MKKTRMMMFSLVLFGLLLRYPRRQPASMLRKALLQRYPL